jgi:hypothetical protein
MGGSSMRVTSGSPPLQRARIRACLHRTSPT